MSNILFSFVLPAYKRQFLKPAIDSIINQSHREFELIIVDDNSPEDLDSIISNYTDSRIRYYKHLKNLGGHDLVKHWNNCVNYAKGKYVILASDDDLYHPDYLSEMYEMIRRYPTMNIFGCRKRIINEKDELVDFDGYIEGNMSQINFTYRLLSGIMYSAIPNYVIKRQVLLEKGGFISFPCAWYSDDATVLSLADKGIAYSSKLLFSFRMSGINISTIYNKNSCCLKLDSTQMFCDWGKQYICNLEPRDEYDYLLYSRLSNSLIDYILNKTRMLIDASSITLLRYIYINRSKYKFVSRYWVVRTFLGYIGRRFSKNFHQ